MHQRRIDEIPGVGMNFIEITESGQKAAELERGAGNEAGVLDEGFFDLDFVFRRDCRDEYAGKVRVDVGRDGQFGFAEIETAAARTDFVAARNETADLVGARIAFAGCWYLPSRINEMAGLKAFCVVIGLLV